MRKCSRISNVYIINEGVKGSSSEVEEIKVRSVGEKFTLII